MAYSDFNNFTNLGQGQGTPAQYGASPRTFEGDLALLSNCPEFSCVRRVKAQIQDNTGTLLDITIWVGIKKGYENIATTSLTIDHVVEFIAMACPPFTVELLYFNKEEVLEVLDSVLTP